MYQFREVRCPYCHQIFMWQKEQNGVRLYKYIFSETEEEVMASICPSCSSDFYVKEHLLDGLKENDPGIVKKGFH